LAVRALAAVLACLFRTPDEIKDWEPASWLKATEEAEKRAARARLEREQERANWRNGQLPYQVAALAPKRPEERRPVLAWAREINR
jgi:hypothetical protein